MIRINLLPPEELKSIQFKQRKIPVIPFFVIVFVILFIWWLLLIIPIGHLKVKTHKTIKELETINPRKSEVNVVWDEVNTKLNIQKEYIETVIISPVEWAQVLNLISTYSSQGVWLYKLHLEQKDNRWLLTMAGYAKPVTARSMIKDIGNYVTNIKDAIELHFGKKMETTEDLKGFVEVSTTTRRKKAHNIELNEFTTTFNIKL